MSRFDLQVLYEDNHLIAVNKPPLIATMGTPGDVDSLVDHVKGYLREKYNKPGNVYLGVVSRLDSFTSGVVLFARTSKAASRLSAQFRDHKVHKVYMAIVEGRLSMEVGELKGWLAKDDGRKRMEVVAADHPDAKMASLRFRVLGRLAHQTLIEIDLLTGRKHQIRVQFSDFGAAIVGDRKYGAKSEFPHGVALHSHRLSLEHPVQKKPVTFESLPPKFWNLSRFKGIFG